MKKLLILVPSLSLGGQERVATLTAKILKDKYQIFFAVFNSKDAVYSPECEVIDLKLPAKVSRIGKFVNVIKRTIRLIKLKRKIGVDYTISFGTTADIINALSNFKGKAFLNIRGFSSVGDSLFHKFIYKRSDGIICCSMQIKNALDTIVPSKKTFVLYNPYDFSELYEAADESVDDYVFDKSTIVMHGRLDVVKNLPRLIKAFSIVKSKLINVQLLIIGEGQMREKLQKLINHYGLQNDVNMIGFRSNPFAYISRSSLYVLPSFSEGFPNALVEGMCFLPVISADCKSGPREILCRNFDSLVCDSIQEADYGILVKPASNREFNYEINDDDEVLADAILSMLSDAEKYDYYKNAAKERVQEFTFETYKANLIKTLEG